jgi:Zn-dependent metalloprotease
MIKKITLTGMLAVLMFCSFAKGFKQEAISYLQKNKAELKLSDQDIADLVVVEDVLDDYTNINRVWLQQTAKGLPLKNGLISVHIKDGKVVNSTNSGVYDLNKQVATVNPALSAAVQLLVQLPMWMQQILVLSACSKKQILKTNFTFLSRFLA